MYDLVIIGHGAAGLAAAVAAAESAPNARIAVLERASEGVSGGNSPLSKRGLVGHRVIDIRFHSFGWDSRGGCEFREN